MLLIFKLLLVPTMIALVSVAGRIWGTAVSGLLGGLPVVAGPILVFLALDNGDQFGQSSAQGALAGVVSIGIFSLTYAIASQKFGVLYSIVSGLVGFGFGTYFSFYVSLSLVFTLLLAILSLFLFLFLFPKFSEIGSAYQTSVKDIFLRMIAAVCLVLVITYSSQNLGPRLSGLLAPFPIAGTILAGFTHYYCGPDSARKLLKGFIRGLFGMAVFDFIFAWQLTNWGIIVTGIVGSVLAVATIGITKLLGRISPLYL